MTFCATQTPGIFVKPSRLWTCFLCWAPRGRRLSNAGHAIMVFYFRRACTVSESKCQVVVKLRLSQGINTMESWALLQIDFYKFFVRDFQNQKQSSSSSSRIRSREQQQQQQQEQRQQEQQQQQQRPQQQQQRQQRKLVATSGPAAMAAAAGSNSCSSSNSSSGRQQACMELCCINVASSSSM